MFRNYSNRSVSVYGCYKLATYAKCFHNLKGIIFNSNVSNKCFILVAIVVFSDGQ